MKVVVTGATGFVGREIVRQLRDAGHEVRALARGNRPPEPGIEFVRGSVLEFATLPSAFAGAQAVIHLVGIIAEMGDQTFERVHTTGTANAVNAARTAGIRRFLQMSALGTRPNAVSRYHRSKWEAEEIVRRSGLQWTLFRPSLIYGPEDDFVNRFARMSRVSPVLPVIGPGNCRMQPVSVHDVARAFVTALSEPRAVGQTLDLCGPSSLTFRDLMREILRATGRVRPLVSLPLPLARVAAAALEWTFPHVLGTAPPLNRDQITMLQEDNVGDSSVVTKLLGIQPVDFATGIRRFLAPNTAKSGSTPLTATVSQGQPEAPKAG